MKYVINRKTNNLKLVNYNVSIKGMQVKPINQVADLTIKAKTVTLVDEELITSYINQVIGKKTDKIVKYIMQVLSDDASSDEDSGIALDELNRLKGVIMKKYREYMIEAEYKNALSKIFIIEEEFKRNYNQKIYMNYLAGFDQQFSSGRGR